MNADQVRAYVAAKWPKALQSPVAQTVQEFCAADEADRAIKFAQLQSFDDSTDWPDSIIPGGSL